MKFYKSEEGIIAVPDTEEVEITCDGKPVEELIANTSDGAGEKHVPVVEVEDGKVTVKVGEVAHPMLDNHFINSVFLKTDKGFYAKKLQPGQEPEVEFLLVEDEVPEVAYEYCNLHGLWEKKL